MQPSVYMPFKRICNLAALFVNYYPRNQLYFIKHCHNSVFRDI